MQNGVDLVFICFRLAGCVCVYVSVFFHALKFLEESEGCYSA
jgi:hypothetical protein